MAFAGIEIGKSALIANQVALNTVGRNIANANNPDYSRKRLEFVTLDGGVSYRLSQAVNAALEGDLRNENARLNGYQSEEEVLAYIENNLNALGDNNLASSLKDFYGTLEDLSLAPHDVPTRLAAIESAQKMVDSFSIMGNGYQNLMNNVDQEIGDQALSLNSLLSRIADLNVEIVKKEGRAETGIVDELAADLRDTRRKLMTELSEIMGITVSELSNGSALVQSNGRTLVFHGETREVYIDRDDGVNKLRYLSDNAYVNPKTGRLAGLIKSFEQIIPEKLAELDNMASQLAWEMNKVHNAGRGLNGFKKMTAETKVFSNYIDDPLDNIEVDGSSLGQMFKPQNGILTLEVQNDGTGSTDEIEIAIDLVGQNKMSLEDLSQTLNQVENLKSSIDNFGRLIVETEDGYSFFIKDDTSNVAAFLGMNNLFSGNSASSIAISEKITENAANFSVAKSDLAGDNSNVVKLIETQAADVGSGFTIFETYQIHVSSLATEKNRLTSLRANQERIMADLTERRQTISGVSLDEEAASIIKYQQSYQASARFISVSTELLDILMSLV